MTRPENPTAMTADEFRAILAAMWPPIARNRARLIRAAHAGSPTAVLSSIVASVKRHGIDPRFT